MAWVSLPGQQISYVGPGILAHLSNPALTNAPVDATNEAIIMVGHMMTSDGASHTIDTTGSSSIGWRSAAVTFSNGGTTVKIGIAPVLTTAGPPGRASHTTDVINFDVSADFTGGGGGITANAWQTSVPTTGTKTIANGDLVAVAIQMTARGGADSVAITYNQWTTAHHFPGLTTFVGGSYGSNSAGPLILVTFSDGALGYFFNCDVASAITGRTWNSGSATKEYGQLYQFPFPTKIYGLWGWVDPDNDFEVVLYSDPLGGSPVAEKTVSIDASTAQSTAGRKFAIPFPAPYYADAYEKVGAILKPGASNISTWYITLANSGHRVALPGVGTAGYGISRATGAFADANSSLDHYYIGLIVGAFTHGRTGGHLGV